MKINKFLVVSVIFLTGCNFRPHYSPPPINLPVEWKAEENLQNRGEVTCNQETSCDIDYWWELFGDDSLNELESKAVQNNPSLSSAYGRIIEARDLAGVSRANLFPQFSVNPAYSDSGSLFELYLPGTASSALPTNTLLTPFRVHQYLYFLPLNLNYELDLWGKLRNRYRADLLTAEAQEQAYLALLLSLTSDLAATYFQLRAFDAQLETMKKAVAAYENVYNLTHSRFQKGLATQMDINLAKANLADTQSSYENLLQQRKVAENEIAVLMGQSPSEFHLESSPLRTEPPRLPPNIPSTVLMQRPDIGQLERDLATQNALIGAAVAGYFPNINLTGAIGYSSPDLTQFLKWISRYWAMGANAKQVAWDWGKLDADVSANFARFGQASDNYRQQVLTALKEVENALSTLEQVDNQYKHLRLAYEALNSSYLLMNERYQKGLSNVIDATLSEISALQAEVQIENMLGISYVSTVQLIKAFGGRWE